MAIKNLTDSKALANTKRGVPIVGKLHKGEEKDDKGRWGKDLEDGSWRVSFTEGHEMFAETFDALFPDTREPFIIATIDDTPDAVFNDFNRLYAGNEMAQIVCDGETIQFSADGKTNTCMDCPVKREQAKSAKEKAKYCTPNAYFRFTIPKFNRALRMPVPFLFQFNVTATTELQHIKKELQLAYEQKGTLINELFLLYRNNRRFNRGGSANDKSLAYCLWLDKNLDEKAQAAQLKLESGDYEQPPQLEGAMPDNQLTEPVKETIENKKQEYFETVTLWANRYFRMELDAFLFQLGAFADLEALYESVPDLEQLETFITDWCIKRNRHIYIYGVRTEPYKNNQRMIIPYGFGRIYSYTRKDFGELEDDARRGYGAKNKKGEYKQNLAQIGDHSFQDAFGLECLALQLGLTETGNLKITKISSEIPF